MEVEQLVQQQALSTESSTQVAHSQSMQTLDAPLVDYSKNPKERESVQEETMKNVPRDEEVN